MWLAFKSPCEDKRSLQRFVSDQRCLKYKSKQRKGVCFLVLAFERHPTTKHTCFSPLHLNIGIYILHAGLSYFLWWLPKKFLNNQVCLKMVFFSTILVILYIRFQGDTERRDKKQVTLKGLIEGLEKLSLLRKACETLRGIEISKKKKSIEAVNLWNRRKRAKLCSDQAKSSLGWLPLLGRQILEVSA